MGSRWAQYQAPFPLMALVLTVRRPSKRLLTALTAAAPSSDGRGSVEVEVVEVMACRWRVRSGGWSGVVTVVSPFWWELVSFWGI